MYISGTFTDNSASDGGGGVYVQANSHIIVISGNTTFIHNSVSGTDGEFYGESDGHRGGILIRESSNAHISGNTTIVGNSANYGGGICLDDNSIMNICGTTAFIHNEGFGCGGGVFI